MNLKNKLYCEKCNSMVQYNIEVILDADIYSKTKVELPVAEMIRCLICGNTLYHKKYEDQYKEAK